MIEQAAHWAAMLDAGDISDEERQACDMWRAAHPLHRRTLDRMRAFDARVTDAGSLEREALDTLLAPSRRHRRLRGALLGISALLLAGWAGLQSDFVRDAFPDYRAGRGEIRAVALDDGSEIVIDTDGAVNVDMHGARRSVWLIRGQLLAKVEKDRARPFIVRTVDGSATALGTSFIVRRDAGSTLVTVIESHVRLCPGEAEAADACRVLAPGESARITLAGIIPQSSVDPSLAGMWAIGWLEADDREAADVLTELARYSRTPVRFDAASLRGIKVTGSFPLRDMDRALDGVARSAGLQVHHAADEIVVSRRP